MPSADSIEAIVLAKNYASKTKPQQAAIQNNKISLLENQLTAVNARVLQVADSLADQTMQASGIYTVTYLPDRTFTLAQLKSFQKALIASQSSLQSSLSNAQTALAKTGGSGSGSGTGTGKGTATTVKYSSTVLFNASSAKENYFKSSQTFWTSPQADGQGVKQDQYIFAADTPSSIIKSASSLWVDSLGSKGMIQTWKPPSNLKFDGDWALPAGAKSIQRYGFQFLYNPDRVSMNYGGIPDVDPSMMSSGKEEYLLSNPSVFKSSITFSIIVNRMFDMKHLQSGGAIKGGKSASDIWAGKVPDAKERKRIYEYGTMYDVEYLLKSMLRYELKSQLRKDATADLGYLGASPIELHLGNKLRYVCQISNIDVNHRIFDQRMVPLFSEITITANRMPDYAAGTVKDLVK